MKPRTTNVTVVLIQKFDHAEEEEEDRDVKQQGN